MSLANLVAAGDEVPGTTTPTGRVAGEWVEFVDATPGSGFSFWAMPKGDSFVIVDCADPADGSPVTPGYLGAAYRAEMGS